MDVITFSKIDKPLVVYRFYCMALFHSQTRRHMINVFNIFGVMYVILMLHAYVTILRGLTGLILWHIYRILMSNGNAPPTKMTISF